ncbi:GerAB/ArcD/ProY family transporter [Ferroacidibacillus organovorans]|uniref:Uncharacterized protein n=1 Tax=Ferroacidibacillus organovorans TaxID=1765683 RepID=A0A162UT25_9BACL|nr:GerAB/ArcD/ProY family transporter [Ferroacidibacillus organovorans]KYP82018.1 hypothetical protein AYJ22_04770 [Ferroacidibacillus organovorans]OAG94338.1 hypothetical protein AYW79_05590 [Ferroacidibacillus organovorans]OPG15263.1 hypothetical protein B2M26_12405 [Ferroacidibacillus organovorans]
MSDQSTDGKGVVLRTGRVGTVELAALLTVYGSTDIFLSFPSRLAEHSAQGAFFTPLLSAVLMLAALFVVFLLQRSVAKRNWLESLDETLTPYLTMPLALALSCYFLLQTALNAREFSETIITTVLPATPTSIIILLLLLTVFYYAMAGYEGLTRVSILLGGVMLVGLIVLTLLPMTWFRRELLFPILGNGPLALAKSGFRNTGEFPQLLLIMILAATLRNHKHTLRVGIMSISFSAVIMSVVLLVFIGTFASAVTGTVPFPMYQLARVIYVGRYVQRLESVFVFLWISAAVIKLGFGLWLTGYLYAHAFRMPLYRPLLPMFIVLIYVLAFLPPDLPTVQMLYANYFEKYSWIVTLALPVGLALIARFIQWIKSRRHRKKKRGSGKGDEESRESGTARARSGFRKGVLR